MRTLDLVEWEPTPIPLGGDLDDELADTIADTKLVEVEFPNFRNPNHYILKPRTTVGLLRISRDLILRIQPQVPVGNLFGMLETVHDLPSLKFYPGIGHVEKIEDIYERLAEMFATRVIHRVRRGLYAAYVELEEDTTLVRGQIDLPRTLTLHSRGVPAVHCSYQLQTVDIDDNRILLWTLDRIPRLGLPQGKAMTHVHIARRALLGSVKLIERHPRDCEGRSYNRLNADYEVLHALARFFLERMGPGVAPGDSPFIPFTVNMWSLFQEYVVACLRRHAPPEVSVSRQHVVESRGELGTKVIIDIVLTDIRTGEVLAVVDAKYKADSKDLSEDSGRIVNYAVRTDAPAAFLVYSHYLKPMSEIIGDRIRVTALGLPLEFDLRSRAKLFADELFSRVAIPPPL
jgi:5-methylcytosine-specific restriction enzyme subunit McrC